MAGERDIKPGLPSVGGHEGVGRVLAIGMHTPNSAIKVGDRVGVKYAINTCMQCDLCLRGYEQREEDIMIAFAYLLTGNICSTVL